VTAGIGNRQAIEGVVGDMRGNGIIGGTVGEANHAGGKRKQVEQPDHGQNRQQPQYIGLCLRASDGHQRDRHRNQHPGHQQHQHNAAAASHRFGRAHPFAGLIMFGIGGHGGGSGPSA